MHGANDAFKEPPTNSVEPPSGEKLKYQHNGGKKLGTTSALTIDRDLFTFYHI
jgi:hypothetical protein